MFQQIWTRLTRSSWSDHVTSCTTVTSGNRTQETVGRAWQTVEIRSNRIQVKSVSTDCAIRRRCAVIKLTVWNVERTIYHAKRLYWIRFLVKAGLADTFSKGVIGAQTNSITKSTIVSIWYIACDAKDTWAVGTWNRIRERCWHGGWYRTQGAWGKTPISVSVIKDFLLSTLSFFVRKTKKIWAKSKWKARIILFICFSNVA